MFQAYEAVLVLFCDAHIPSMEQATVFFIMCICLKLVFALNCMHVLYFGNVCIHFRVYVPYTHICVRNASSNTDPKHTEKINNKVCFFFGTFRNNQKLIASKGYFRHPVLHCIVGWRKKFRLLLNSVMNGLHSPPKVKGYSRNLQIHPQ